MVDVLRVWLPSIITIFGQAASTPAELMGAFALAWFIAGVAAVPAIRLLKPLLPLVLLVLGRLALVFVHGGQAQLYVASATLLAGLIWLSSVRAPMTPGVPLGLAAAALEHAALGTVDLSWRPWWLAVPVIAVLAAPLVALRADPPVALRADPPVALRSDPPDPPARGGGWSLVGPALLLTGVYALSPAVVAVAASYGSSGYASTPPFPVPPLALGIAVFTFLAVTFAPRVPSGVVARTVAAVLLVGSAACFSYDFAAPGPLWLAVLLGAPSLALALRLGSTGAESRFAAALGMVVFAVAAIAYYAAYDIGFPNQWVPVAVALIPAGALLRSRGDATVRLPRLGWAAAGAACLLPLASVWVPPSPGPGGSAGSIRLVAYNIRMGFGLDGTYRPADAAAAIAATRPDIVVLSEVDRAWLLNGGHDDLAVLARLLHMRYYFGPAADAVWGDAILTNLPVGAVTSVPLTAAGAPTGAQALGAVVTVAGHEIAVVSTHIQPPPSAEPLVQVREIAAFATRFAGSRPTFIAGDLNVRPGSPSLQAFAAAGYTDGLAPFRPLPTFPADHPVEEIDHVLVNGLTCADVHVGTAVTSDHALLAATLAIP
ncbi:endonuclease/exonuclease/phosphatase family protein [Dactylosporangium vinaceum]|uniref:Endonuclease/exonuclease/phosphatase family protein n=1 Tax=Dactylosporangium vinaceum TaxID=53362 RepID=A0ABV5MGL8_9ACTN|nr:endonuclease/exonuclease/phosphatase family protein [Dactylosporangium vinaceum]UAB95050.1 endonuclease/exonuclease/phosphatase family protein [Dactylosporangium vinaceum]